MNNSLDAYRNSREDLLARIVERLSGDERFVAAWLGGSYGRNEADAVSDLDLNLVVAEADSESLCRRAEQVSSQTTEERLKLFRQFGTPAVIHENNDNAPDGGTFTFTLYAKTHLMVDWILIPQSKASRPAEVYILFEKSSIPVALPAEIEKVELRVNKAAERVAFFWMMMAVTAKYLVRRDKVFVVRWLEELSRIMEEVEGLITGKVVEYSGGSRSVFEPTIWTQKQAIVTLGERMEGLLPELIKIGAQVSPSPMGDIRTLLYLADDE